MTKPTEIDPEQTCSILPVVDIVFSRWTTCGARKVIAAACQRIYQAESMLG